MISAVRLCGDRVLMRVEVAALQNLSEAAEREGASPPAPSRDRTRAGV
jgi:hypothetical protein